MPIPLIVWGIGIAGSAIVGLIKVRSAISRIKKAKARYAVQRSAYEAFIVECESKHKYVSAQFDELCQLRLQALITLGIAVEFLEKAKLKERDILERFEISAQRLVDWKKASVNAAEVLDGIASSTVSGVATATSTYGLVGMLASASTGTAISGLSGAAATNATLAWLGGGTLAMGGGGVAAGTVVFGGLVVGPAIMVMGFAATWKAAKIEAEVEAYVSEMDVDEENKRKLITALDVVVKRVHELRGSTGKTESELKKLLRSGNPLDMTHAYMVAKTARALGDLLEVAILDEDGQIIEHEEE